MSIPVGIVGWGTYFPQAVQTAADLVEMTGIPEAVLRDKMGIRQRHIAGEHDTISYMATCAARQAIADADIRPEQIRLVISHGSEHKDHLVWNAAAKSTVLREESLCIMPRAMFIAIGAPAHSA